MALKKLPKAKKVKELEKQDKELAKLPDPKKEKKILEKTGQFLKKLIGHKSAKASESKIKKQEKKDIKEIKDQEKKDKKLAEAKVVQIKKGKSSARKK